jgi:hypothetical protein
MITELGKDDLVALGVRHRVAYLVQQAGYTLGLAAEDGAALEALLEPGYVGEVSEAADAVRGARGDRALIEAEAKEATQSQNQALRQAKVWRRKVVRRAQRMARMGRSVPDVLAKVTHAASVPQVAEQIERMLPALDQHQARLGGSAAQSLIDEGKRIVTELVSADAAQEQKRLAALPAALRDYFEAKGRLYVGIKVLNDAGHELHAEDAAAAGRYNLKILHRRG